MKKLNNLAGIVSGGLVFVIGIISTYEVIMRGFFDMPSIWSLDVSQYLLIWSLFLGTAYSLQEKGHVAVDFVRDYLKKKSAFLSRFMAVLGLLVCILVIAVLLWNGVNMSRQAIAFNKLTASMIQIPVVYLTSAIILGSFLMLVTAICILADLLGGGDKYL